MKVEKTAEKVPNDEKPTDKKEKESIKEPENNDKKEKVVEIVKKEEKVTAEIVKPEDVKVE